ncbi:MULTISPECIES: hypothetical protein [Actinosynnema]|uniref:hypothetical protein n=1 Tax=Actinosynnema TaxID=40566 RepID=UPI0020A4B911|nr:hypothetical protein [Actinosynnema pretiosum]MCP2099936.1 hypothetical protein [Actinosynnema pretiosum]
MNGESFSRRVLAALAGSSPAFTRPVPAVPSGRGRRVLAALAGTTPAFTRGGLDDQHTITPSTGSTWAKPPSGGGENVHDFPIRMWPEAAFATRPGLVEAARTALRGFGMSREHLREEPDARAVLAVLGRMAPLARLHARARLPLGELEILVRLTGITRHTDRVRIVLDARSAVRRTALPYAILSVKKDLDELRRLPLLDAQADLVDKLVVFADRVQGLWDGQAGERHELLTLFGELHHALFRFRVDVRRLVASRLFDISAGSHPSTSVDVLSVAAVAGRIHRALVSGYSPESLWESIAPLLTDMTEADLRGARVEVGSLDGVRWSSRTRWPEELREWVREHSEQIGEDLYEIHDRHDSRDRESTPAR